jgi:hypothetical protein
MSYFFYVQDNLGICDLKRSNTNKAQMEAMPKYVQPKEF